jgi:Rrf2 family nitric oxide-sensitive transcriptional repressor
MHLSQFSDIGLRLLISLAHHPSKDLFTISVLAKRLSVSENHLVKIVHFMGQQGWIVTLRGKNGGFRLAEHTLTLRIGDLVQTLESDKPIIDCNEPPCPFAGNCHLRHVLGDAEKAFFKQLNQYQLKDMVRPKQKAMWDPIPLSFPLRSQ